MSKVRKESVTVKVHSRAASVKVTVEVVPKQERLRFGHGNAKIDDAVYTFSLPAGFSCPFAHDCLSRSDRKTGRIKDGPATKFRCFAATSEARGRSVRESRWHNYDLLRGKSRGDMTELVLASLSRYAGYVRIHVSGDFFTQDYFDAWLEVAWRRPKTTFYAYTKALPFWVKRLGKVPDNFVLTASVGGTHDHLIDKHGLRYARVVFSKAEAADLGLEIDHDDSHAMQPGPSFALLLHGTQPPGSPASKALSTLWAAGEFGYGERADAIRRGRTALAVLP